MSATRLIRVPVEEPNPDQLAMPFAELTTDERKLEVHEQFALFHERNPQVYEALVRLAREAKAVGHRRLSIWLLWGKLRWEYAMKTSDPSGYKLNNNYTPHYSRLMMAQESDLAGFFETRQLRA